MSHEQVFSEDNDRGLYELIVDRQQYRSPILKRYGQVGYLTRANGSPGTEANCGNAINTAGTRNCSDRRAKENIVRIGTHPLGIGVYLFDYKDAYRTLWGEGRQFGVIADEVETVMPVAVSVHPDGYKMVDYGMLGIRASHYTEIRGQFT
jgi:hypothetical protein